MHLYIFPDKNDFKHILNNLNRIYPYLHVAAVYNQEECKVLRRYKQTHYAQWFFSYKQL